MKKVGILGNAGTLGHYLSWVLKIKYDLYFFDKKITNQETDYAILFDWVKRNKLDVIINAIGSTDVKRCENDLNYAITGNILIPKILQKIKNTAHNKLFIVHFSSDQVYPGVGNAYEDITNPKNNYGRTKLHGESLLDENNCIFRINYVSKGFKRLSYTDWIYHSLIQKEQVKLYSDVYFNPVTLDTISEAVFNSIDYNINGTFNVGCKQKISKADFYQKFSDMIGLKNNNQEVVKYEDVSNVPRPLDMSMNIESALSLGFDLPNIGEVINKVSKDYKYGN
jgi:dTDP-4-dehydrorhamnose reductase